MDQPESDDKIESPLPFLKDAPPELVNRIHDILLSNNTTRVKNIDIIMALTGTPRCIQYIDWTKRVGYLWFHE